MRQILLCTTDRTASRQLGEAGNAPAKTVTTGLSARTALRQTPFDTLLVDLAILEDLGQGDAARGLAELVKERPSMPVLVLADTERVSQAVDLVRAGAHHYLTLPLDPDEAAYALENLQDQVQMESELDYLRDIHGRPTQSLITASRNPAMREAVEKLRKVASTKTTVLLTGETGTGKSLFAKLVHEWSARADKQFIGLHCGAIPETLVESELFGHEKGAFTGATRRKLGKFEIADKGTLFLDEIGTIPQQVQIKLLQVLQERSFQRVGGETDIATEARIIAATNEDLKQLTEEKRFRKDLFYRLAVFPVDIPPLRERKEDIPLLARNFLDKYNQEYAKGIGALHDAVLEAFASYDWPGNVRELENLVERAYILESSNILTPESFPSELFAGEVAPATIPLDVHIGLAAFRDQAKENAERQYLKEALATCAGRINKTSELAGITPRQLRKLLAKYGIRKQDYK